MLNLQTSKCFLGLQLNCQNSTFESASEYFVGSAEMAKCWGQAAVVEPVK
ncbi:hypothetical protein Plhal710r2_c020g0086291 [Plasmopara halstedii]